ncbi:A-kinase anchor protein 1, mitochondrial isoform X1 [Tachysurus vachellii]|uniref:A-kinase anchor protein 1, mitochondrial isoform X1 n=1 Tax=Tachysurus vachellii TaxID=175792 RepID=UPI00296AE8CD|nr:A-kinase anchor protein 1, mitochondrial isoform X1 [Tachysurus vachellii]
MLKLPIRPLVPLSALALLGWCWYTVRKKRNLCERSEEQVLVSSAARKQSIAENVTIQDAASGNALDSKTRFQSQEKLADDQNHDLDSSQPSSTMEDSSVLSANPQTAILTSTPVLKGIRPEPEGEVSKVQASLLLAEKSETETDKEDENVKGHSDIKAIKTQDSFAQQPTGIVCPKEHGVANVSEKQYDSSPCLSEADGPVVEVISGVAEEITAIGGILKRKGHVEPRVTPQSQVQLEKTDEVSNILAVTKKDPGALTKTMEESVSSAYKQNEPPTIFPQWEDSGCSMCHSEDGVEAEKASSKSQAVEKTSCNVSLSSESHQAIAPRNGNLSRQKADTSKGVNGTQSTSEEGRVTTSRATQSRNSPHILWNIEVPAHLIGRLIGKKGKYICSVKQSSGAKICVSALPYTYEFQICHIEGSEVQVDKALALIRKKFKDLDLSNRLNSSQPAAVHSLPITSWLPLPQDGTVEVIVPRVEAANYLFVQQHTHPTYYGLCSLTEQMLFCYCHSGCPSLPTPVEAGVLCAAPSPDGAWWRAQVIQHYKDSDIVQIRYVDYGGYVTVNLTSLKQIRSDFVTLPFQASEVMLENIAPLPGKGTFSFEAKEALEELTRGIPLIMKVTGSQNGLPLVHMWRHTGEEMMSLNGVLVDRGLCSWLDSH